MPKYNCLGISDSEIEDDSPFGDILIQDQFDCVKDSSPIVWR